MSATKVANPIPRSGLFATPADLVELERMLENIGDSNEKRIAYSAAMWALNLAHKLVEEQG